jgi:hypothetical protein
MKRLTLAVIWLAIALTLPGCGGGTASTPPQPPLTRPARALESQAETLDTPPAPPTWEE